MAIKEGLKEWWNDLRKIWKTDKLHCIERPVGMVLFFLKIFILLQLVQFFWGRRDRGPQSLPDWYVVGVTVFLAILLAWSPYWSFWSPSCSLWIARYLLASVIVYLLNVVLLSKVFGGILSRERSLILLIFNVAQVVLIFAIFYRSEGISNPLVEALLVFGTVSFHPDAKPMAAFQVTIDFMLLAVFLAHFVGGLGRDPTESEAKGQIAREAQ